MDKPSCAQEESLSRSTLPPEQEQALVDAITALDWSADHHSANREIQRVLNVSQDRVDEILLDLQDRHLLQMRM